MIVTPRLTLRPPRRSDLDALHEIYSDARAMRFWSRPPHESRQETADLLEKLIGVARDLGPELVIERQCRPIGRVGLWREWEFGYLLHADHWGRGYATEAVLAFLPAAFARHPECEAITADIDPNNRASARVLEKAGFTVTGHATETYCINGITSDSTYYRLPRPARA